MNQLSRQMRQALEAVSTMPSEQQDLLAAELLALANDLSQPATILSAKERTELEAELAAARRGELATDADAARMFAKYGL